MGTPGRNSPCPCGSGKKYKVCCLVKDEARGREARAPDRAAEKALSWLLKRHGEQVRDAIENVYCAVLEDAQLEEIRELPEELYEVFHINSLEWVLSEGETEPDEEEEPHRFMELILGQGPELEPSERRYLELLGSRSLDLYEVVESEPGKGLWLISKSDPSPERFFVREMTASRELASGDAFATRVIPIDPPVLSGAMYGFPRDRYLRLRSEILEGPRDESGAIDGYWISDRVIEAWLGLLVGPPPILTDASTGEPIALTTVDYHLEDWEGLVEALSGEPGVEFDAAGGTFEWIVDEADGMRRTKWIVRRSSEARLHLDARTAGLADEGEKRLMELAGSAVTRLGRQSIDPRRLWKERHGRAEDLVEDDPFEGLSSEERNSLVEQVHRQIHARWADEPIPLLKDRTPRQAIQDEAGLADVVELLRSYEIGERERAEEEGRTPVDFLFLWESLGLDRSQYPSWGRGKT
jgi:hypothetical protein